MHRLTISLRVLYQPVDPIEEKIKIKMERRATRRLPYMCCRANGAPGARTEGALLPCAPAEAKPLPSGAQGTAPPFTCPESEGTKPV